MAAPMRDHLEGTAAARRKNLEGIAALTTALQIPIRSGDPDKKVALPVKRVPLRPRVSSHSATSLLPKYLADEVYQDIVHTIEQMTRAMERTPTAARLGEGEIRDLILFVLNANYEGNVRGEVFNCKGKTDLLLPWEGENAFIGECKFWTGPKNFRKTIDQLLRYVTWRDTKAALVLFIKKGAPTGILRKAHTEITEHPAYFRTNPGDGDTRRDYTLRAPTDPSRRIELALVLVVIPDTENSPSSPTD